MKVRPCRGVGSIFDEMLKTAQPQPQAPAATQAPGLQSQPQAPAAQKPRAKNPVDMMKDRQRSVIVTELAKVKAICDQMLKAPFLARNPPMAASLQNFNQVLIQLANQQITPQEALAQIEPFTRDLSSFHAQWQGTINRGNKFLQDSWQQINKFHQLLSRIK